MPWIDGKTLVLAAIVACFGLSTWCLAQQKPASLFTVANVRAEADAANSVDAKKLAILTAESRAFRQLVGRLADFRAQARVPELPAEQIERLVSNVDIRGEGVSATSYVASFGVTFSERAVESLLAQHGVVSIIDRGPEILIVPVYIESGAARTTDRNPWRSAFLSIDAGHALTPAKIAPVRGDLSAAIANAYIAHPAAGLETLKSQYHTTQLVLAVAELDAGGESLTVKLIGSDSLGPFSLQRKIKSREGIDDAWMQTAARLVLETVQQRWKLTRASLIPVAVSQKGDAPGAGFGGVASLQVTAQYSGLKEWQTIRARLQSVPGIQNWDLRSVDPRSAQIAFDFPGGAERLAAMANAKGLSVEQAPEGLIVKTK